MSKITFRADDDLVERLDAFEASKSEVMREALRAHLAGTERGSAGGTGDGGDSDPAPGSLDEAIADRVDALVAERVDALVADRVGSLLGDAGGVGRSAPAAAPSPEVNLTVTVEGASDGVTVDDRSPAGDASDGRADASGAGDSVAARDGGGTVDCAQCGEPLSDDHVYCPNCGEKASRRLFCDCGDEVRSDWAFCPSCGRRTPAADVLDERKPRHGGT